jgi:Uma2 family endonuclease
MSADIQAAVSSFHKRSPRSLNVVWDPPPNDIGVEVDWSKWYLTDEDDMGEGGEQNLIIRIFISILTELAHERGWSDVFIGADQFFAWVEEEPLVRVSPDVYVLDFQPARPLPASWQTWRSGHRPPRLAVEIVSEDWRKDYEQGPLKYAQLGVRELVVFDPEAACARAGAPERVPIQVFRREVDGGFLRVHRGGEPARSEELDAWLVVMRDGEAATLGVSRDASGLDLVPTLEQARLTAEARIAELERKLAVVERK